MDLINYRDIDTKNKDINYYLNEIKYVLANENVLITKKEYKDSVCFGGEELSVFKSDVQYRINYRGLLRVEESDLEDDDELIVGDVFEADGWDERLFTINTISHRKKSTSYIMTHDGNIEITEDEKNLLLKELFNEL